MLCPNNKDKVSYMTDEKENQDLEDQNLENQIDIRIFSDKVKYLIKQSENNATAEEVINYYINNLNKKA